MENLVKCKRCKQVMIDEQYDDHICTVLPKGDKKIDADYYIITKDSMNRIMIEVKGLDGFIYKFPIIPDDKDYNKIPYQTPNLNTEKINSKTPEDEQNLMPSSGKSLGFDS